MDSLTQRLRMTTASDAANMPTTVRDDCHAAADRIAALEAEFSRLTALLDEARAMVRPFHTYAPEQCYRGNARFTLIETHESGGGWIGAEDFRAARAFAEKAGA